jgi:hypothetical protein
MKKYKKITSTLQLSSLSLLATAVFATTNQVNAASIIWVNSSLDGSVANTEWNNFLTTNGHTVTWYSGDATPSASDQTTLNSFDLIIQDNTFGSGVGTASVWNGLTAPLISMNAFGMDNWGWTTDSNGAGGGVGSSVNFSVENASDPIWDGVDVSSPPIALVDSHRSMGTALTNGGTIVSKNAFVADDILIAQWDADSFVAGGGARMFFVGSNTGNDFHLSNADGETVFLNAIDTMAIPEPSTALLGSLGLFGLILRRRR